MCTERFTHIKVLLLHGVLVVGCAPKPPSDEGDDSIAGPNDSDTDPELWPQCDEWSIHIFRYYVGPDDWGNIQPDVQWPVGHHTATCTVDAIAGVETTQQGLTSWRSTIALRDCVHPDRAPASLSLDLSLVMTPPLEVALVVDQSVTVSYSVEIRASFDYSSWYSLRAADTGDLLLAAFADPGPTVAPKIPGQPTLDEWLSPFSASLGEMVCPAGESTFDCENKSQRAAVELVRGEQTLSIVGSTSEDLGDYIAHVGFAGEPGSCDGVPSHPPIHGVIVKKP